MTDSRSTAVRTVNSASLAEVAWVDPQGAPRAIGVIPLLRGDEVAVAFTFDRVDQALALAGAEVVDLVVREPRNTASGWRPAAWRCTSRLVEDVDGDLFVAELLDQELRRYPPARRYADSPMLCREHWWYLPRLILQLDPVAELEAPAGSADPQDVLLVTATDGRPVTGGARLADGRVAASWGPSPAPGPGLLHGQDATFPDLEDWLPWEAQVSVAEGEITAEAPPGPPRPVGAPTLRRRWRREREFAAACRAGLAAWTA